MTKPTPDLIETMHADDTGVIDLLPEHLARLASSAKALGYWHPGEDAVIQEIEAACSTQAATSLRVRLLLSQAGMISVEAVPLGALAGAPLIGLASTVLNSVEPLLQHKTTYRPWYDATTKWLATHGTYFDQIYVNERNELCEGSRSNIYLHMDGKWLTPPLHSGLLGGTMRARLLSTGLAQEAVLHINDLPHAQAVRLSNGLRGWFDVKLDASLLPGHFLP
ncbi:MAG: aminotransferase class IV [Betaproteobacteria bacterium]